MGDTLNWSRQSRFGGEKILNKRKQQLFINLFKELHLTEQSKVMFIMLLQVAVSHCVEIMSVRVPWWKRSDSQRFMYEELPCRKNKRITPLIASSWRKVFNIAAPIAGQTSSERRATALQNVET